MRTDDASHMEFERVSSNILIVRPCVNREIDDTHVMLSQRQLLDAWIHADNIKPHILWYYTPMAVPFTSHLSAALRVYDCMDELSGFAGAPHALRLLERQLMSECDVVFTGGNSLYEAKSLLHKNCHAVPSSVDVTHFRAARDGNPDPVLQHIPHPRLGYCGVIDERLDLGLIAALADLRPDWHQVYVGPVTKIDPADLPRRANIHYLGAKQYAELPGLMAGLDVGLMPFAMNDATRYISPTKTPEYLAAGLPVVSTPVRDVVRTWGNKGLVEIGATPHAFMLAIERCLSRTDHTWKHRVDRALSQLSWDASWQQMHQTMVKLVAGTA